jgi:hypothetical protein
MKARHPFQLVSQLARRRSAKLTDRRTWFQGGVFTDGDDGLVGTARAAVVGDIAFDIQPPGNSRIGNEFPCPQYSWIDVPVISAD